MLFVCDHYDGVKMFISVLCWAEEWRIANCPAFSPVDKRPSGPRSGAYEVLRTKVAVVPLILHASGPVRSNLHAAGKKWDPGPRTVLGHGTASVNLAGVPLDR